MSNIFHHSEPCSGAIDFRVTDSKPVIEKEAVLRFLVALSGSVANDSVDVIGHQNDLWAKGTNCKQVHYM